MHLYLSGCHSDFVCLLHLVSALIKCPLSRSIALETNRLSLNQTPIGNPVSAAGGSVTTTFSAINELIRAAVVHRGAEQTDKSQIVFDLLLLAFDWHYLSVYYLPCSPDLLCTGKNCSYPHEKNGSERLHTHKSMMERDGMLCSEVDGHRQYECVCIAITNHNR